MKNLDNKVQILLNRLEKYSPETYLHSLDTCRISQDIADAMGLDKETAETLRIAALVHDVGKLRIPDEILHKQGKLTEQERGIMQMHPVYSKEILEAMDFPKEIVDAAFHHHEFYKGGGYPQSLKEDELSLIDQILSVSDVTSALTMPRAYKAAFPPEKTVEILHGDVQAGKLNPDIVDVAINTCIQHESANEVDQQM